jgi:hypothetical protein
MSLPRLENWTTTAYGLYRGALLLGALQRLTQPPQPAYLELGLQVQAEGFSTGRLPSGGQVALDLTLSSLVYTASGGAKKVFPLDGRTQSKMFTDLFGTLAGGELAGALPAGTDLFERLTQGVAARGGRYKPPRRELFVDETTIQIDPQTAKNYLAAVQVVFTAVARFTARLSGMKTSLVVWPEHFDLSTLWFTGNEIDESQPHLNFGFAPFSEGIEAPYLYAYAYPYPDRYDPPSLPEGAAWHTQGWTGVVLPYDVIARQADSQGFIETGCAAIYAGLRALITT